MRAYSLPRATAEINDAISECLKSEHLTAWEYRYLTGMRTNIGAQLNQLNHIARRIREEE